MKRATSGLIVLGALLVASQAWADAEDDPVSAAVLFARARLAEAKGHCNTVIKLLDQALSADMSHMGARHLRGMCHYKLGHLNLAERDLMAVSYRRPKDVLLRRLLARVRTRHPPTCLSTWATRCIASRCETTWAPCWSSVSPSFWPGAV